MSGGPSVSDTTPDGQDQPKIEYAGLPPFTGTDPEPNRSYESPRGLAVGSDRSDSVASVDTPVSVRLSAQPISG